MESTNKRYLLAININNQFLCWVHGARVLSPVIAAASIAVILAHTEKEPTMAFFNKEVRPLSFITSVQMPEICEKIVQCATAVSNLWVPMCCWIYCVFFVSTLLTCVKWNILHHITCCLQQVSSLFLDDFDLGKDLN